MGTNIEKKNQHIRRMAKALKHAKKRDATPYVQARIEQHIKAITSGKVPEVHPERPGYRQAAIAANQKHRAEKIARETAENRQRGRIQVIGVQKSEAVAT